MLFVPAIFLLVAVFIIVHIEVVAVGVVLVLVSLITVQPRRTKFSFNALLNR